MLVIQIPARVPDLDPRTGQKPIGTSPNRIQVGALTNLVAIQIGLKGETDGDSCLQPKPSYRLNGSSNGAILYQETNVANDSKKKTNTMLSKKKMKLI